MQAVINRAKTNKKRFIKYSFYLFVTSIKKHIRTMKTIQFANLRIFIDLTTISKEFLPIYNTPIKKMINFANKLSHSLPFP
jgi:hypothetical protein